MFVSCSGGIIFISILASVGVGRRWPTGVGNESCLQRFAYAYGNDSCIFIDLSVEEMNQVDAKQACKHKYSADLPIMDTFKKAAEWNAIAIGEDPSPNAPALAFWIRLQRDVPYNDSEARNLDEWKNPEKWSWGPGQSTLKNWNAWNENEDYQQPDNSKYISKKNLSVDLANTTERCVMAVQRNDEFKWYDMLCESGPDFYKFAIKGGVRFLLACQGIKKQDTSLPTTSNATPLTSSIATPPTSSTGKPLPSPGSTLPPTTTSTDTPSPTTTSEPNHEKQKNPNRGDPPTTKPPFPWPWLMGGLAVALVLVCVALVIIAVFVRRRRRRRAEPKAKHRHHRHHRHHRTETDVSSSPSWRHPRERDEHRRHVEDEISRRQHRSGHFSRRRSDKKPTEVTTRSGRLPRRRSDKESTETKRRSGRRDRDN